MWNEIIRTLRVIYHGIMGTRVCRRCHGTGHVGMIHDISGQGKHLRIQCGRCGGSGREWR